MTVRPAGPGDVTAIVGIWNHYIRETDVTFNAKEKSASDVARLLAGRAAEGHATFVAVTGGRVQGFASYGQFRGGVGYARTLEHSVMLAPEATGGGLGRALMGALLDHARAAGGHSVFAGISSGNPAGLAFHAALGFQEEAVLREAGWKNGRWWDLHLLRYWL